MSQQSDFAVFETKQAAPTRMIRRWGWVRRRRCQHLCQAESTAAAKILSTVIFRLCRLSVLPSSPSPAELPLFSIKIQPADCSVPLQRT